MLKLTLFLFTCLVPSCAASFIRSSIYDIEVQALVSPPFDFYVFAQSWQAEFCQTGKSTFPGCQVPLPYWTKVRKTKHDRNTLTCAILISK